MATEPSKPKKRIVKPAETVREKTEKAALPTKPKKNGPIRLALSYIGAPFRWIGKPVAKIGHLKPFRILGRILWPTYFRNSWKELRQVTWPNRRETWQLTLAVIIFSVIFGLLIALVDFGLDKAFKQLLIK